MSTVEKAEKLAEYLKWHDRDSDPVIDRILDKLLDRERQHLLKQRDELRTELKQFEQQYGITSSEFFDQFERGELEDSLDLVDWSGAWRVYNTVQESLNFLQNDPTL